MNGDTFRSRVVRLAQKSRKALRLYSSMGQKTSGRTSVYSDWQVQQWQEVNSELVRELTKILERPHTRKIVQDIFSLCDTFYGQWHVAEAELESLHRDLVAAAEHGDFVRSAKLSSELISLKARVQASQAVYHEIQDLIDKSKVARPVRPQQQSLLPLDDGNLVNESLGLELDEHVRRLDEARVRSNKVIPLRRRSGR